MNSLFSLKHWKQIILHIYFFFTYYNIENKNETYSEIKSWTDELSVTNIIIYQIFILILLVISKTIQDA